MITFVLDERALEGDFVPVYLEGSMDGDGWIMGVDLDEVSPDQIAQIQEASKREGVTVEDLEDLADKLMGYEVTPEPSSPAAQ